MPAYGPVACARRVLPFNKSPLSASHYMSERRDLDFLSYAASYSPFRHGLQPSGMNDQYRDILMRAGWRSSLLPDTASSLPRNVRGSMYADLQALATLELTANGHGTW